MKQFHLKLITIIVILFTTNTMAQDVYRTLNGKMLITVVSNDSILKIKNDELVIQLNYETARFTMKMDKSNFKTGIDSLDKKLAQLKYEIIEYKGVLGVQSINTEGHPPLDFNVEGVLSTNNNIIKGTGHLEHIANRGLFSCVLTLKFNINKNDLGLNIEGLVIEENIQIEIVQNVLNKI
ncbi:MAG: hypothetical protein P1U44_12165 [Vicingaceae bacterium]|nr:MAG: hypothetical protein VR77_11865 [Flavobacteriales bacterium BRH_c54]MBL1232978.1 hypothetical protein [Flavobacteriales bacterium]MDF1676462.1 hypothetical protein [Vicingaceae bacterium]